MDGPTPLLCRCGWAFVALDADGTEKATAHGVPPAWIGSIFGAEAWAVLQAVTCAGSSAILRIDCKAAVDILCAGKAQAVRASRITAPVWADIFAAAGDTPPEDVSWMPAHTAAADVGCRRIGNGQLLTADDRRGNDIADRLAKRAVEVHRVPSHIRKAIAEQERRVDDMAWWVARVTIAANSWGHLALRDSDPAPDRRARASPRQRRPAKREEIPLALGGHDITHQRGILARKWQCRVCHRSSANRAALSYSRCPGSAVKRWAQAAAAATCGKGTGVGHHMLLTGNVVWCWRCGANACVQARSLAQPCAGRPRGFLAQARQRLLLGLHPSSRKPLGDETVPEPGSSLPEGFQLAVLQAGKSKTTAVSWEGSESCFKLPVQLFTTPRLEALRGRVAAKEAAAREHLREGLLPQKRRRRLHGKQSAEALR